MVVAEHSGIRDWQVTQAVPVVVDLVTQQSKQEPTEDQEHNQDVQEIQVLLDLVIQEAVEHTLHQVTVAAVEAVAQVPQDKKHLIQETDHGVTVVQVVLVANMTFQDQTYTMPEAVAVVLEDLQQVALH